MLIPQFIFVRKADHGQPTPRLSPEISRRMSDTPFARSICSCPDCLTEGSVRQTGTARPADYRRDWANRLSRLGRERVRVVVISDLEVRRFASRASNRSACLLDPRTCCQIQNRPQDFKESSSNRFFERMDKSRAPRDEINDGGQPFHDFWCCGDDDKELDLEGGTGFGLDDEPAIPARPNH